MDKRPTKNFRGLSATRSKVFESIAIGGGGEGCHPMVLKYLEDNGFIESVERPIYGNGNSAIDHIPVMVKDYYVPIPVHMEWCEWCSKQFKEQEKTA